MDDMTTLGKIVESYASVSELDVIYAARPWTRDSPATIRRRSVYDDEVVEPAKELGLEWFMEGGTFLEFIAGLRRGNQPVDCDRIIHYAIYDA